MLPLSAKNEAKTDVHDFVFYGHTELSPKEKALKEKQEKEEAKKVEKQKKEEKKKAEKAKTTQPSAEVPAPAPAKKPAYEKGELPAVAFIKPEKELPSDSPLSCLFRLLNHTNPSICLIMPNWKAKPMPFRKVHSIQMPVATSSLQMPTAVTAKAEPCS